MYDVDLKWLKFSDNLDCKLSLVPQRKEKNLMPLLYHYRNVRDKYEPIILYNPLSIFCTSNFNKA